MSSDFNPYQSPQIEASPATPPPRANLPNAIFHSNNTLAMALLFLIGVCALVDLGAIVSTGFEIQLLNRVLAGEEITMAEADANDVRQGLVGMAQIVLIVVTGIVFCVWMYRVHRNLPALHAKGLEYTPGWAAGSWFVPILNLFRPYQIMQEIWKHSDPRQVDLATGVMSGSALVGWWWGVWIICGILGQITFRVAMRAEELDMILFSS